MRTRSSSNLVGESSPNPTTSNPKRRNHRRSKQPFSLEESPLDTMADQRTMAELLRAPTEEIPYGHMATAETFELSIWPYAEIPYGHMVLILLIRIQNQLRIQVGKFVISADGMTIIILYGALKVEMGSELLVQRHALIESKEGVVVESLFASMQSKGRPLHFVLCIRYDQSDEDFFNLIKFLKKRVLCFNNDFIALCFKQGWKDALSSGIRTYSDAFSLDAFPCLMLKKDNLITHNTVIIKNYYSNVAAMEGLSFKIDKIVQAWNEMFDTKHPQSGVPFSKEQCWIRLYNLLIVRVETGSELLVERHALNESKEGSEQRSGGGKPLRKKVLCFNNDFIALCFKQGWKDALSSEIREFSNQRTTSISAFVSELAYTSALQDETYTASGTKRKETNGKLSLKRTIARFENVEDSLPDIEPVEGLISLLRFIKAGEMHAVTSSLDCKRHYASCDQAQDQDKDLTMLLISRTLPVLMLKTLNYTVAVLDRVNSADRTKSVVGLKDQQLFLLGSSLNCFGSSQCSNGVVVLICNGDPSKDNDIRYSCQWCQRKGHHRNSSLTLKMNSTMLKSCNTLTGSLYHYICDRQETMLSSQTLNCLVLELNFNLPDESSGTHDMTQIHEVAMSKVIVVSFHFLSNRFAGPSSSNGPSVMGRMQILQKGLAKLQRQEYELWTPLHVMGYLDPAGIGSAGSTSAGSDPAGGHPAGHFQPAGSYEPADQGDPAASTSVSADLIPVHADESTLPPGQVLGSSETSTPISNT
ncbi:hypothetical protein Tco_1524314 [Tanacetum coccineum]